MANSLGDYVSKYTSLFQDFLNSASHHKISLLAKKKMQCVYDTIMSASTGMSASTVNYYSFKENITPYYCCDSA